MDNMTKKWYVIHVPDKRKIKQLDSLFGGYDITFWRPTHQVIERIKNKLTQNTQPLFEGYVFAHFNYDEVPVEERIRAIGKILKSGDNQPIPLADDEVVKIRTQEFTIMTLEKAFNHDYSIGDNVSIIKGSLKGIGQVTELNNTTVKVEVKIFNRPTTMVVPYDYIQKEPA
jgi:transcription antitermination factor NusG